MPRPRILHAERKNGSGGGQGRQQINAYTLYSVVTFRSSRSEEKWFLSKLLEGEAVGLHFSTRSKGL